MLVLGRKKEEEIVIADTIVVKVVEICGDRVKLGITAPDVVSIMRRELLSADLANQPVKETASHGVE